MTFFRDHFRAAANCIESKGQAIVVKNPADETVFGVITVTKTLTEKTELNECVENLKSVKVLSPNFHFPYANADLVMDNWNERFPFKCIFAFAGELKSAWASEWHEMVQRNIDQKRFLPDLVIMNKSSLIQKTSGGIVEYTDGTASEMKKHFHYHNIAPNGTSHAPFLIMLHEMYKNAQWQNTLLPQYELYFSQDLQ